MLKKKSKILQSKINKDYDASTLPLIKVSYADVLTRPLYYPENDFAADLVILMRRKSFTKAEIDFLRSMGCKVEVSVRKIQIPENLL